MARCRAGYLAALLAAGVFFICFEEYFSFYFLILVLIFPLFSLAVSLPGMLGCRASLDLPGRQVRRDGGAEVVLRITNRLRLPLGRVSVEYRVENLLTGETDKVRRRLHGVSGGAELREDLPAGHCGVLRWEAGAFRVCDLLGLFALRRPLPPARELTVLPLDLPPEPVPVLLDDAHRQQVLKPRPGGGPGEDYDLRPYRPGDPLRSVHWKLSSKVDGLVVRETLEPLKTAIVLTYDHFGTPAELDAAFDRLDAVSRALIERERPHAIAWADPEDGRLQRRMVNSLNDLRAWEWEAFSTPAPLTGRSVLETPLGPEAGADVVRTLHISAEDGEVARLG